MDGHSNIAAWIRLTSVAGLGAAGIRRLLGALGPPDGIFRATHTQLARIVGDRLASALLGPADGRRVEEVDAWLSGGPRFVLTLDDEDYPPPLKETPDPPPVLYAEGRRELLRNRACAIVGSRNPSATGVETAQMFARALSDAGLTVVSGLALGIDAAAHVGALEGRSSTIAVLGTGANVVYPRRNQTLFTGIARNGLLLSELPLGTSAMPFNFPRRNRIISGLSLGCVVIEASLSSGSLITARLAADQGREVFAVPGSIHSPLARGSHALIKQGAKLTETAQDILEELGFASADPGPAAVKAASASADGVETEAAHLLEAMGHDPVGIDILCMRSALTPDVVSAMLTLLEMNGLVTCLPGGRFQRQR